MRRALVVAMIAGLALVACGNGEKSDEEQVRDASKSFFEAIASPDSTLPDCLKLVVPGSQAERTQRNFAAYGGGKPGGCGYGRPIGQVPEITEVRVHGDTARITARAGISETGMRLRQVNGHWLVEHPAVDPLG
jgi:hypothetical protein